MGAAAALLALVLVPPVGGEVTRGFDLGPDPYAAGQHRGADFAARPGTVVRAPCGGRVVVAGRVGSSGGVVTVLCGRWRVSVQPLATIAARRGAVVGSGARVGTLARSSAHAGVHLGVRRDGARFGYVDPLRFLEVVRPGVPVLVGPRGRARRRPLPPARRFVPRAGPSGSPFAPWPAWAGLALVLGGAGVRWRRVRLRARRESRRTSTAAG